MKKIICMVLVIVIASIALVSCTSTITPTSTPSWTDGELLSYSVRKASDYELTLVNIGENFQQILPEDVAGTYVTRVTTVDAENYKVETTLDMVETFTPATFGTDTALFERIKDKANQDPTDALTFNGTNIIVHTVVYSVVQFNSSTFLPTTSTKSVRSAVFMRATTVNGKKHDGQFEVNDYTVETTYDYSAKSPKATVKTTLAEEETTTKLQKSSAGKTFDNEQLAFLLRSYSLDTLKANLTTPITVFDSMQCKPLSLSLTVNSNPVISKYQIGGTWNGINPDSGEILYYQTEDGTQYTDAKGNVVTTVQRPVAQVYLVTGGKPIYYYFDNLNSDSQTFKNALIRMQQSYIVCEIDQASLALL